MRLSVECRSVWFSVALGLLTLSVASAQQPPSLGYAWPPVLRAGESNTLVLGGYDFTPDMQIFVHGDGLRVREQGVPGEFLIQPPPYWFGLRASSTAQPIPRELPVTLVAAPETPEGLVAWQVANANGGAATAMLFVSRGEEVVEQRSRDFPQELPGLPIGVSGRLAKIAEVDRYTIRPAFDGLVTVDLLARRLGTDFYGALKVTDDAGHSLVDEAATAGDDPIVTFAVKSGRAYTVHVSDIEYRGHASFVYRLGIRPGPRVVTTVPAAIPAGQESEIELVGYGIATGTPRLETWKTKLTPGALEPGAEWSETVETPAGPVICRVPVSASADEMRAGSAAMMLQVPQSVSARMEESGGEHRYEWQATEGMFYSVRVASRACGGSLDVSLKVTGPDGSVVMENDDAPGTTDAAVHFSAAVEGRYTAVVRDLSGRPPGLDAVYRIEVTAAEPGFKLAVPQQVNVPLGGTFQIPVTVERYGGFAGEIQLAAEGLPEGVSVEGDALIPANGAAFKLPLKCDAAASTNAALIRIRGTADVEGTMVSHDAVAQCGGNLCPRSPEAMQTKTILLSITMAPPFELQLVDRNRQRDVHRGTTYPAQFQIVRDEGYAGEIQLQMAAKQARHRQGIRGPVIIVPADQQTALYPCFMPEWLSTDITRRMVVMGSAPVVDPSGETRYVTRLADARITMIMEGALLKIAAGDELRIVSAGESFEIPFLLSRSPKLPEEARVELVVPDELEGTIEADAVVVAPDTDNGSLQVRSVANEALLGPWQVTLRATSIQDGRWPVISETPIEISLVADDSRAQESVSKARESAAGGPEARP